MGVLGQSMGVLKIGFALLVNIYAPLKRLISKKSQFNPKQFVYNNVFSVQLPCLARHSLR